MVLGPFETPKPVKTQQCEEFNPALERFLEVIICRQLNLRKTNCPDVNGTLYRESSWNKFCPKTVETIIVSSLSVCPRDLRPVNLLVNSYQYFTIDINTSIGHKCVRTHTYVHTHMPVISCMCVCTCSCTYTCTHICVPTFHFLWQTWILLSHCPL